MKFDKFYGTYKMEKYDKIKGNDGVYNSGIPKEASNIEKLNKKRKKMCAYIAWT